MIFQVLYAVFSDLEEISWKSFFTRIKTGSKLRLEMDEDSSTEQKIWPIYSFGKINVFRLHLNESA